ncbi:fatty acid amide hydrolase-like isoform X1 [Gossypium australe]|uniref:Fatty acid amide hydrolase-like isoform X1 n=1 Tax=Gossypium australe TaxID=47621 RepID=A0A5B6WF34_9ROSI|nr:fatty acid amide hydrolase-like isoform X1 [Gossypium australe]
MGLLRDAGVVYKPVEQIDLGPCSNESYFKADKAPRMAGFLLKIFAWFLESRIIGALLLYIVKKNNQVHKLVSNATLEEPPMFVPLHPITDCIKTDLNQQEVKQIDSDASPPERVQQAIKCIPVTSEKLLALKSSCFRRWTIADYSRAYSTGEITPLRVAEHFIDAVRESCSPPLPMSFFINSDAEDILRQATESTLRYERGNPISALDGVLIAIKDEIDCYPYPTTGGTKWLHKFRPCTGDACCVMRLRSCGAILVGKTNMHELGAGVSGINPHYGPIRNPYDPKKICGGSSSGSAAVVSSGLCPVALGVDSGGSVRMPASLCGVFGFKPTFGCIPHSGVLPLNWTVGTVGILAATLDDAFIVYAAISGDLPSHKATTLPTRLFLLNHRVFIRAILSSDHFCPFFSLTHGYFQPKVQFPLLNSTKPISNIRFAKYGEWFNDCSDEIRICCSNALNLLCEHYKWKTVGVTIPDIESMLLAHYVTISSECSTSLSSHMEKLDFAEIGWDVRVALRVCGAFHGKEYIQAQKMRNRQMQIHNNIFAMADVIVAPTTGRTAYSIVDDALKTGEVDCINGAALIRYQIAGNFLGLPAVTVPVGYDKAGLPIGLQFIGKPWSEPTLMHVAYGMQALCISEYRKPKVFYDLFHKN